ncbi:hypothetical protein GGI21_000708 [Coemansia aciculifera]|nr:hypothetical protein GGI21_000708 [Coemansia aciculifera]
MCKYRDSVVRRAVARHIMQQVRHSRVSKYSHNHNHNFHSYHSYHRRSHSAFSAASAEAQVSGCSSEPELRPRPATAESMTTAAISALAAAMSVARMENDSSDELSFAPAAVLDAETLLVERIVELQREKEFLLRIVQSTSS